MTNIYLLPGMGATSEMYSKEIRDVEGMRLIDWPEYKCEKTIKELAERIIKEQAISEADFVGGSSLGGIVSLEISKMKKVKGVILIGSCLDSSEINPVLRLANKILNYVPLKIFQKLAGKMTNDSIIQMFSNSDEEFLRNMSDAVFAWEGYKSSLDKIHRIHGERDRIIPYDWGVCVKKAGHLIAYTHGRQVAKFIERVKNEIS